MDASPATPPAQSAGAPTLGRLAAVFARYANMTFGGGSATIAVLHRQLVDRRAWLSQLQFDLCYALSRLTPGTNLLAFCTASAWLTRRSRGAVVALLAASLPCSIVALVASYFYEAWQHDRFVMGALRGALAAAVAIMVATAWSFAQPHVKSSAVKALVVVAVASLPVIRDELVVKRHLITDDQLNASFVITRSTPGPVGLYVVSVGYFADGVPGAVAGWLAMSLPSLVIIMLVGYFGQKAEHPRLKGMLRAVVLASAALLIVAAVPLARDADGTPLTAGIALAALVVLLSKKVDTSWVIGGAAAVSLGASLWGVV